jgi:hypothetical protein
MNLSVLHIAVLALYLVPFGTQVYGSTESTNQCDLLTNRSCPQSSNTSQNTLPTNSETEAETTQTPLILPDLSPTREDLNNAHADESAKTVDSNDNDATSASTDSDDNDVADNSNDEQETNNNGDSEDNDGEEDTGDGPSIIPFP